MHQVNPRKATRQIRVGNVPVGGGAPIAVQSMTNTPTPDIAATVAQIRRLEAAGCDIVRVAVPDNTAAAALTRIKEQVRIPVIADIHFRCGWAADQPRQHRRDEKSQGRCGLRPRLRNPDPHRRQCGVS
jgi:4-hydroxy-3-methylbut-2-en-1-yl diphosphate synthase IspG/GcpE